MLNNRKLILKFWFGELKIIEIVKDGFYGLKKNCWVCVLSLYVIYSLILFISLFLFCFMVDCMD